MFFFFSPSLFDHPQLAVVGISEDNNANPTQVDGTRLPPSTRLYPIVHRQPIPFRPPNRIPDPAQNSLDAISSPPMPPIRCNCYPLHPLPYSSGSILVANSMRLDETKPEEHEGLPSLEFLVPPSFRHGKSGAITASSVGNGSTKLKIEDN